MNPWEGLVKFNLPEPRKPEPRKPEQPPKPAKPSKPAPKPQHAEVTVPERIAELVAIHGSMHKAAKAIGIGRTNLHALAAGQQPREPNLTKLGLQEVITYRRI